jgi:hypothetical protein
MRGLDKVVELSVDGKLTDCQVKVYLILIRLYDQKKGACIYASTRWFDRNYNVNHVSYQLALDKLQEYGLLTYEADNIKGNRITMLDVDGVQDGVQANLAPPLAPPLATEIPNNLEPNNTIISDVAEATQPAPQIELFEKNYPIKKKRKPREPKVVIPFVAPTFDEVVKFGIQQAVIDGSTAYEGEMTGKKFYFKMLAKGWANDKGVHTKDWRGDLMIWIYNIKLFKKDKPQSGTDGVRSAQSRPLGLD